MASHAEADRSIAAFGEVLASNPNVAYVSVEERDGDWVLVVGVIDPNLIEIAKALTIDEIPGGPTQIPSSLPIPSDEGVVLLSGDGPQIAVITEASSPVIAQWTDFHRPAEGGDSVGNARVGGAGTLGAAVTLSTRPGKVFIMSNWHVLHGGSGGIGDAIFQQAAYDGGRAPAAWIAALSWAALTSKVDLALAEVRRNSDVNVGGTRACGRIVGLRNTSVGASVKKCGRTTNSTTGTVRSINATVNVSGYPGGTRTFTNQIMTTDMSRPGDSGSVLMDSQNYMVGLVFAGNSSDRSFANRADEVNNALQASFANQSNLIVDFS